MTSLINHEYAIGDIVYIITDEDQNAWQVYALLILPGNLVSYKLTSGTKEHACYEMELSREKQVK